MPISRILYLVAVLVCAGCVVVGPILHDEPDPSSARSRIDHETRDSILVGSTTLEDVLKRFGEPEEHFDAPTVLLYRWTRLQGIYALTLMLNQASEFESESLVEYTLHIAFDENDKVSRYKISKLTLFTHEKAH